MTTIYRNSFFYFLLLLTLVSVTSCKFIPQSVIEDMIPTTESTTQPSTEAPILVPDSPLITGYFPIGSKAKVNYVRAVQFANNKKYYLQYREPYLKVVNENDELELSFGLSGSSTSLSSSNLNYPIIHTIDSNGRVYIADYNLHQIKIFSASGTFITSIGQTTSGTANGQFNRPKDIKIANNTLYVLDATRVQLFSLSGTYLDKLDLPSGSGDGQFDYRASIAISPVSNHLFVGDSYSMQEFDENLDFVARHDDGQFYFPLKMEFNSNGYLSVLNYGEGFLYDVDNFQVMSEFDQVDLFSSVTDPFIIQNWQDATLSVDENDYTYFQSFTYNYFVGISQTGSQTTIGSAVNEDNKFMSLQAMIVDPVSGGVVTVEHLSGKLQIFDPYGAHVLSYGGTSTQLYSWYPNDIAINRPLGKIYVLSLFQIYEFDLNGQFLSVYGTGGAGNGQINSQSNLTVGIGLGANFQLAGESFEYGAIAIDKQTNNIIIGENGNHRIQVFSASGTYITKFGSSGTGDGQFMEIMDIEVDSQSNIYVSDSTARIQKFSSTGVYISTIGSAGSGNGQFSYPASIKFDADGNLWVGDAGNHRIQKLDSNGNYLSSFYKSDISQDDYLNEISQIDFDPNGNLVVADGGYMRIHKFTTSGTVLSY